jgi:uncharacterized protein YrrD
MRPGKDLIGKRIYSVDKGDHLGSVKDLYFDAGLNSVVALYLGSEGLLSRKAKLIKLDHIIIMGNDVVLVDSSNSVSNDKDVREAELWLRRDDIAGRQISTPGGTRVGDLGDVLVGSNSQITGFQLSHIQIEGPVAARQQIDRDVILDIGGPDIPMTIDLAKAEKEARQ